jgi:hypothetical protein
LLQETLLDYGWKGCYDLLNENMVKSGWFRHIWNELKSAARWLIPGLGVKRWLVMILLGTTLIGVGFGVVILEIYRTAPESWWLPLLSFASLDLWWTRFWIDHHWHP